MPIYDFKCPTCGSELKDQLAKANDFNPICSKCGIVMVRQIGNVGIAFKGPGFFVNDYGRKK